MGTAATATSRHPLERLRWFISEWQATSSQQVPIDIELSKHHRHPSTVLSDKPRDISFPRDRLQVRSEALSQGFIPGRITSNGAAQGAYKARPTPVHLKHHAPLYSASFMLGSVSTTCYALLVRLHPSSLCSLEASFSTFQTLFIICLAQKFWLVTPGAGYFGEK